MTAPARFREVDIKRAIKGIKAAGEKVSRVAVEPNGRIVVYTDDEQSQTSRNEWDEVFDQEAPDAP